MDSQFFPNEELITFLSDPNFRQWVLAPTPELEAHWQAHLAQYPEQKASTEKARQYLLAMRSHFEQPALSEAELEAKLQSLLAQRPFEQIRSKRRPLHQQRYPLVAAAVALLLVFCGLFFWIASSPQSQQIATGNGEQKSITLPDGSLLHLNANSTARFATSWKQGGDREVWLTGEGFFEVSRDQQVGTKFRVRTNGLMIEVLGTVFNVRSRAEKTRVYLEEGKINLKLGNPQQEEIQMSPGDLLVYSDKTQQVVENRKATTQTQTSWKDGVVFFEESPLKQVFQELSVLYGVDIEIKNPQIENGLFTAGLPVNDLQVACKALERSMGLQIEIKAQSLIIR